MGTTPFRPINVGNLRWNDSDRLARSIAELGLDKLGPIDLPLMDPPKTPDGRGTYVKTTKGVLVHSDLYGSVQMAKTVSDVWLSPNALSGAPLSNAVIVINTPGNTLQTYLGLPIKNSTTSGDATIGWFEKGMLVVRPSGNFVVYGPIYLHYMRLGGPDGWAGLPTSSVQQAKGTPGVGTEGYGGGLVCHFAGCDVYWCEPCGAAEVHGYIRDRYNQLGASASPLGFPMANETIAYLSKMTLFFKNKETYEAARFSRFEKGAIYWSAATGAWDIGDWMLREWDRLGGLAAFGCPTSEPRQTASKKLWYQNFADGVLVRPLDGKVPFKVSKLDVYIDRFETKDTDTVLNNEQELYLTLKVNTSDGQSWQQHYPEGASYYNQGDVAIGRVVKTLKVRDGGMTVDVTFDAWDDDDGPDTHLAVFSNRHTIENLWDIQPSDINWHGDFRAFYSLRPDLPYDETKVRQDMFWQFGNPTIPQFSKDTMAQTYSDVGQDEKWWQHPFNALFYELVYSGLGKNGCCFGMSLEAARAHQGKSISSEPINRYDYDSIRLNEVMVRHGYQLGGDQIDYFAKRFLKGDTHDPVKAFMESRAAYAAGDYPILSLSNDTWYSKGHAVMPYKWDSTDPNRWVIYIANPNFPLKPGSDTSNDGNPGNIIEIMAPKSGNPSFVYKHGSNEVWSGTKSSGGRMLAIPLHVLMDQPRTPFWEVLIAAIGATFFLCADATTDSVAANPAPLGATQADTLPPGVVPMPFYDVPGRPLQMLRLDRSFFNDPRAQGVAHRIRSNGKFTWAMRGPGMSAVVHATGAAGVDTVVVSSREVGKPAEVLVAPGNEGGVRSVSVDLAGHAFGDNLRQFRVDAVSLAPGRTLRTSLASGGEELVLQGDREPITVRISAQRNITALTARNITISPHQSVRLRPTDWTIEKLPSAKLDVQVMDLRGGIVARQML